jgi:HPt (histidine-containing phosphotransfer) domain-containing protein
MSERQSLDGMFKLLAMLPAQTRAAMVTMYCEALESHLALIRQSLAQGEVEAIRSAAHKIAGSAGMMQDQEVARAARDIEAASPAGAPDEALRHWPVMLHRARITLESLRQAYPAPQ